MTDENHQPEPVRTVCVARHFTPEAAHIGRIGLETQGISSFIEGDLLLHDIHVTGGGAGVRLFVMEEDAEKAFAALSPMQKNDPISPEEHHRIKRHLLVILGIAAATWAIFFAATGDVGRASGLALFVMIGAVLVPPCMWQLFNAWRRRGTW